VAKLATRYSLLSHFYKYKLGTLGHVLKAFHILSRSMLPLALSKDCEKKLHTHMCSNLISERNFLDVFFSLIFQSRFHTLNVIRPQTEVILNFDHTLRSVSVGNQHPSA